MALSMMSRVALGHTGRDVRKPSRWVGIAFAGLVVSVLFRALVPMIASQFYMSWMLVAAMLWIFSFAVFVVIYTPILLKPRADGAFG